MFYKYVVHEEPPLPMAVYPTLALAEPRPHRPGKTSCAPPAHEPVGSADSSRSSAAAPPEAQAVLSGAGWCWGKQAPKAAILIFAETWWNVRQKLDIFHHIILYIFIYHDSPNCWLYTVESPELLGFACFVSVHIGLTYSWLWTQHESLSSCPFTQVRMQMSAAFKIAYVAILSGYSSSHACWYYVNVSLRVVCATAIWTIDAR